MKRMPLGGLAIVVSTFCGSFYVWHRIVGYNSQVAMEQAYAKNFKMLRNVLIQQWRSHPNLTFCRRILNIRNMVEDFAAIFKELNIISISPWCIYID